MARNKKHGGFLTGPYEDQVLIEFPKHVASSVRQGIRDGSLGQLMLVPKQPPQRDVHGNAREFELNIPLPTNNDNDNNNDNSNNNQNNKTNINDRKWHKFDCQLCDLPCIIETQKTFNKNYYFKSGDISQILKINDFESSQKKKNDDKRDDIDMQSSLVSKNKTKSVQLATAEQIGKDSKYQLKDGITPPANDILDTWNFINKKFSICECNGDDINAMKLDSASNDMKANQQKRLKKCSNCGKITRDMVLFVTRELYNRIHALDTYEWVLVEEEIEVTASESESEEEEDYDNDMYPQNNKNNNNGNNDDMMNNDLMNEIDLDKDNIMNEINDLEIESIDTGDINKKQDNNDDDIMKELDNINDSGTGGATGGGATAIGATQSPKSSRKRQRDEDNNNNNNKNNNDNDRSKQDRKISKSPNKGKNNNNNNVSGTKEDERMRPTSRTAAEIAKCGIVEAPLRSRQRSRRFSGERVQSGGRKVSIERDNTKSRFKVTTTNNDNDNTQDKEKQKTKTKLKQQPEQQQQQQQQQQKQQQKVIAASQRGENKQQSQVASSIVSSSSLSQQNAMVMQSGASLIVEREKSKQMEKEKVEKEKEKRRICDIIKVREKDLENELSKMKSTVNPIMKKKLKSNVDQQKKEIEQLKLQLQNL